MPLVDRSTHHPRALRFPTEVLRDRRELRLPLSVAFWVAACGATDKLKGPPPKRHMPRSWSQSWGWAKQHEHLSGQISSRPHRTENPPKGSGLEGKSPAISGKSRLVKYYNLARFVHCEYCDTSMGTKMCPLRRWSRRWVSSSFPGGQYMMQTIQSRWIAFFTHTFFYPYLCHCLPTQKVNKFTNKKKSTGKVGKYCPYTWSIERRITIFTRRFTSSFMVGIVRIDRLRALSCFYGWWCMAVLSWWSDLSG